MPVKVNRHATLLRPLCPACRRPLGTTLEVVALAPDDVVLVHPTPGQRWTLECASPRCRWRQVYRFDTLQGIVADRVRRAMLARERLPARMTFEL